MVLTFNLYCVLVGFIYAGGSRKEHFHFENLGQFEDEHQKTFGKDSKVNSEGYPDTGNGRYAKNFSYREWFDFNAMQRHHGNFMESIVSHSLLVLVAGLRHPLIASYCCAGFILSRFAQVNGNTKFAA